MFKGYYYHTNALGGVLKDDKGRLAQEYFFQDDVWKNYEIHFADRSLSFKDYQFNRKEGLFKRNYGYMIANKFRKIRKALDHFDYLFMNKWNEGLGKFFNLYSKYGFILKNSTFMNFLKKNAVIEGYEDFKLWEFCDCRVNNPADNDEVKVCDSKEFDFNCDCFKTPRDKMLHKKSFFQNNIFTNVFFTYDKTFEKARLEYVQEMDSIFLVLTYTIKEDDIEKTIYFKRFADCTVNKLGYNNRIQILKRKIL